MISNHKTYLGDAVYAEMDAYGMICLTTEDGIGVTNEIYLEPQVYNNLVDWREHVVAEMRELVEEEEADNS